MNCEQARSLLAAHRELKNGIVDTTELDVHLERCPSCRQVLARSTFIGKSLRALPEIETPPEMYTQLMHKLANEHLQFMQRATPGSITTPEFLKPYLQEHAQSRLASHPMSALSTAATGPLPIIHAKRRGRPLHTHRAPMSQFAILGLAAAFLVLLMMGGVTSLVFLAQHNAQQLARVTARNVDVIQNVDIHEANYATATLYPHIASAVANSDAIYYTAYTDSASPQWMLLQMDRNKQQTSSPLLATLSSEPMVVLGSSSDWLVWLQYGTPKAKIYRNVSNGYSHAIVTPWNLYALSLTQLRNSQQANGNFPSPQLLLKGIYDPTTAPSWVHTPVQGIWFMQDTLLIAALDASGTSHLLSSQLNLAGKSTLTTLATAASGHIYTSPTADSSATEIFWADEWISNAGALSSNILQLLQVNAPGSVHPTHGHWNKTEPQVLQQALFRGDSVSFHPQITDDMLFWINSPQPPSSDIATSTPTQTSASIVPRLDAAYYAPPLDATVRGQVMMQPIAGDILSPPTTLASTGQAYSLQSGTDFILWQTDKGYVMYDVPSQSNVTVGTVLNEAGFLAVNNNTAVWIKYASSTTTPASVLPAVHIYAFNWPK
ncbi:MAG TPA: hypothetical protein VGT44_11880 [Ktedonobacteraceae bacterium]|nr:hypothetical protein [Ktedonobacteraceae bacterium]